MRRERIESRRKVKTEKILKSITILDLLCWINSVNDANGANLLMEPYHVADSNCQHFAAHLWHNLSNKPYPNPSRFELAHALAGRLLHNFDFIFLKSIFLHASFFSNLFNIFSVYRQSEPVSQIFYSCESDNHELTRRSTINASTSNTTDDWTSADPLNGDFSF